MDYSLPSFSVHGILQARILEWTAICFSWDLRNPGFKPGSPALQADSTTIVYEENPVSHRCVVGEERTVLITFADNGGSSPLTPHENLPSGGFSEVSCCADSETTSVHLMNSSYMKTLWSVLHCE